MTFLFSTTVELPQTSQLLITDSSKVLLLQASSSFLGIQVFGGHCQLTLSNGNHAWFSDQALGPWESHFETLCIFMFSLV